MTTFLLILHIHTKTQEQHISNCIGIIYYRNKNMDYTTEFEGHLVLNKKLNKDQFTYLKDFVRGRRMKRDINILAEKYMGKYGYPGKSLENNTVEEVYGVEGAYFSRHHEDWSSILDHNMPPGETKIIYTVDEYAESMKKLKEKRDSGECQPGLWCNWEVVEFNDNHVLEWNKAEKFYEYVNWLKYLINNFFNPWGVKLNGELKWLGEDTSDFGIITVLDNIVEVYSGHGG
jgi:hypothetical protein